MITTDMLQQFAKTHGTPLFVIDHDELRSNYATVQKNLPRVQAYYAVKANPIRLSLKTLFEVRLQFWTCRLSQNSKRVYEYIKDLPEQEQHDWIWNNIIYANPIKADETLRKLDKYQPLVTFDNLEEISKIRECSPNSRVVLRLRVSNAGAMVELSSKFGASHDEAIDLIFEAVNAGLTVAGLSFHVGSQTTNLKNYMQGHQSCRLDIQGSKGARYGQDDLLDIAADFLHLMMNRSSL